MNPRKTIPTLIRRLIEAFVAERNQLRVHAAEIGGALMISIRASQSDTGRIVGKQGHHLAMLTTLVEAMGEKAGLSVFLEHLEPFISGNGPVEMQAAWNDRQFEILAEEVARAVFEDAAVEIHRNGITVMVEVRTSDKAEKVEHVGAAMKAIFNAIGKANGRKIFVSVLPELTTKLTDRR